ncbi:MULTISPECIES: type VII secretion target [unclassified Nocardia]|uniref:type VII secretion target n=1 Tax=Nocardia sp. AG03 TaxID=3025312 RepID=UPI002418766E|nr:hypothetical protein [Nocardia sp. AG03]
MADSLKADIDELNRLSGVVQGLAQEAGAVACGKGAVQAFGTGRPGGVMASHEKAITITTTLLHDALREGAEARLVSVAQAMSHTATTFKDQDESARDQLVALYNNTTGAWTSEAAQ